MSCKAVWIACGLLLVSSVTGAATEWSTQDYDLYVGDFNEDQKDDVLYVAKSADKPSGIALSDGNGPNVPHQSWPSNQFGIPWSGNLYRPIIGDFNGDGQDDVLMQRKTPGDHYVLWTNSEFKLTGVNQTIPDSHAGFTGWSAEGHRIVVGDFNGDNRDDVFLQAVGSSNQNGTVVANGSGFLAGSQPAPWANDYLGLKWSARHSIVHVGDFDGDGRDDLLLQGHPDILLVDYDVPIPVPFYRPNLNALLTALEPDGAGLIFRFASVKRTWNRNGASSSGDIGGDWSPKISNVIVGRFDADNCSDIILQPLHTGGTTYRFLSNCSASAPALTAGVEISANVALAADQHRLIAADWNDDGVSGLFVQALTPSGTNSIVQSASTTSLSATPYTTAGLSNGIVDGTAAGASAGEFSVDPSGSANYKIPIVVPPGVAGLAPQLAISYASRTANGVLGTGWTLSGLSAITRCPATFAQDTFADGVDFDANDRFCLDGARLMTVNAAGAEMRTELESWQRVQPSGSQGLGPQKFTVLDKSGMKRIYGDTPESRLLAAGRNDVLHYGVNRITDRFNNFINVAYEQDAANSSFWPTQITYGHSSSVVVGTINLEYEGRDDISVGYIGGSQVSLPKRLKRIRTFAGSTPVREYRFGYVYALVSNVSQLAAVQECELSNNTCLPATRFKYQTGTRGFSSSTWTATGKDSMPSLKLGDFNGNGHTDYLYTKIVGNVSKWVVRWDNLTGAESVTNHTVIDSNQRAVVMDFNGDGFDDALTISASSPPTGPVPTTVLFGAANNTLTAGERDSPGTLDTGKSVAVDMDGNGLVDVAQVGAGYLNVALNMPPAGFLDPGGFTSGASVDLGNSYQAGFTYSVNDAQIWGINFDSDGRADVLVLVRNCLSVSFCHKQLRVYGYEAGALALRWSSASSVDEAIGGIAISDVNGDGLSDLVTSQGNTWKVRMSTGTTYAQTWSGGSAAYPVHADTSWLQFQNQGNPVSFGFRGNDPTYTLNLTDGRLNDARAIDYNSDGRMDLLVSVSGHVYVLLALENGYGVGLIDTGVTNVDLLQSLVVDYGGDGLPDIIFKGGTNWEVRHQRGPVTGLMYEIVDGLGAKTQVEYSTLSDPSVYGGATGNFTRMSIEGQDSLFEWVWGFPYRNLAIAMPVVKRFATDNGRADATIYTSYLYRGAKVHLAGRGFVGFSEIKSWNDNTRITTTTHYMQDYPNVGMVIHKEQRLPDSVTYQPAPHDAYANLQQLYTEACETSPASCAMLNPTLTPIETRTPGNKISETWSSPTSTYLMHDPGYYTQAAYLESSTEWQFPLAPSGGQPAAIVRTHTAYANYDTYGNVGRVTVIVDNGQGAIDAGGDEHKTVTENTYYPVNQALWCIGLLKSSTVTHARASYGNSNLAPLTDTRSASFAYDPGTCALTREMKEPGANDTIGSATLKTTYAYDAYGNRETTTVEGAQVSARATVAQFEDPRFPTRITDAASMVSTQTWDARNGRRTSLTTADGLTSQWRYDGFGRKVSETAPRTAAVTSWIYERCGFWGNCRDGSAAFKVSSYSSDGSQTVVEYDKLGRDVLTRKPGLAGVESWSRRAFDPLGREYATAFLHSPDLGEKACWAFRKFDLLGRVVKEWTAANSSECASQQVDANGRIAFDIADSAMSYTRLGEYLYNGLTTQIVSPRRSANDLRRRAVNRETNVMGRLRRLWESDGVNTIESQYDYDPAGNLTWARDAAGNVIHSIFDKLNFKVESRDPDMGTWLYDPDALGQVVWQRDAKLQESTQSFDVLGRLRERVENSHLPLAQRLTTTWTYNDTVASAAKGKLESVTAPDGYQELFTYDAFGTVKDHITRIDGAYHWVSYTYDALGRVDSTSYPNRLGNSTASAIGAGAVRLTVKNVFQSYGYLESIRELLPSGATGTTYWRAEAQDSLGNVTRETVGNNVTTMRTFNRATGHLELQSAGIGMNADVMSLQNEWDNVGNLLRRDDYAAQRYEAFTYDDLYRLATFTPGGGSTQTMEYDVIGNIKKKGNDYTDYSYTAAAGCTAHSHSQPHAVKQLTAGGAGRTYCYDANGNMVSGAGRTITYTPSNSVKRIDHSSGQSSDFLYNPTADRFRQVAVRGGVTETTSYVDGLYEKVVKSSSSVVEHVHYLKAGDVTVGVVNKRSDATEETSYWHKDHLGTVAAITLSTYTGGTAGVQRASYDPWGKRRNETTWASPAPGVFHQPPATFPTKRGFTGHEQLDHIGLVHMNGRVYDPEIGRFLSADTVIQQIEGTQGFNRYTYVINNPLSLVDPSGHVWAAIIPLLVKGFGIAAGIKIGATVVFIATAVGGFIDYQSTGDIRSLILPLISFGVFYQIGSAFQGTKFLSAQFFEKMLVSGFAGGALSAAGGGRFKDGFLSSGFSAAAGGPLDDFIPGDDVGSLVARTVTAAVIGGTASSIGGGRFGNGAITASFQHLFNEEVHRRPAKSLQIQRVRNVPELQFVDEVAADVVDATIELYPPGSHKLLVNYQYRWCPTGCWADTNGLPGKSRVIVTIYQGEDQTSDMTPKERASALGHESVHGAQILRGGGMRSAAMEAEAYKWQWDHRNDSRFLLRKSWADHVYNKWQTCAAAASKNQAC